MAARVPIGFRSRPIYDANDTSTQTVRQQIYESMDLTKILNLIIPLSADNLLTYLMHDALLAVSNHEKYHDITVSYMENEDDNTGRDRGLDKFVDAQSDYGHFITYRQRQTDGGLSIQRPDGIFEITHRRSDETEKKFHVIFEGDSNNKAGAQNQLSSVVRKLHEAINFCRNFGHNNPSFQIRTQIFSLQEQYFQKTFLDAALADFAAKIQTLNQAERPSLDSWNQTTLRGLQSYSKAYVFLEYMKDLLRRHIDVVCNIFDRIQRWKDEHQQFELTYYIGDWTFFQDENRDSVAELTFGINLSPNPNNEQSYLRGLMRDTDENEDYNENLHKMFERGGPANKDHQKLPRYPYQRPLNGIANGWPRLADPFRLLHARLRYNPPNAIQIKSGVDFINQRIYGIDASLLSHWKMTVKTSLHQFDGVSWYLQEIERTNFDSLANALKQWIDGNHTRRHIVDWYRHLGPLRNSLRGHLSAHDCRRLYKIIHRVNNRDYNLLQCLVKAIGVAHALIQDDNVDFFTLNVMTDMQYFLDKVIMDREYQPQAPTNDRKLMLRKSLQWHRHRTNDHTTHYVDKYYNATKRCLALFPEMFGFARHGEMPMFTPQARSLRKYLINSLNNTLPDLPDDVAKGLIRYNSPESNLFFRMLRCPSMAVLRTMPRIDEATFKKEHDRILKMMPVGSQAEIYKVYNQVTNELNVQI